LRKRQGFCFSEALTARWHKLNEKQNPWQCKSIAGPFSVSCHSMEVRRHGEAIGGNLLT